MFLVCYDIADKKRLSKVHRYLVKVALPIQYSVFLAYLTANKLETMLIDIKALINLREDDVRVYPLPDKMEYYRLGRQQLPEGVMLFKKPAIDSLFNVSDVSFDKTGKLDKEAYKAMTVQKKSQRAVKNETQQKGD